MAEAALIDFRTSPDRYRHWKLSFEGPVAYLTMDVNEDGGLRPGYKLKLNSYDLGVDIELADAVQRLRFEHPEIGAVVIRSQRDRIFCSGANINMLGLSSHDHKVNFCKFTNETRLAIEDASQNSGQNYICSISAPSKAIRSVIRISISKSTVTGVRPISASAGQRHRRRLMRPQFMRWVLRSGR